MILTVEKYKYICANCDNSYLVDVLPGDNNYGRFLLRSEGADNIAYLDSFSDKVFDEFKNLLYASILNVVDELKKADVFQDMFGICCDPDVDGSLFGMRLEPKCPKCGMRKILKFTSLPSQPLVLKDIPIVTHNHWYLMNYEKRLDLINLTLKKKYLCN